MEQIPSWYWMTIIGFLTALFGLILYYLAQLIKETTTTVVEVRETITDSRKLVQSASQIVEEVQGIIGTVKSTVDEVNVAVLGPVRQIGETIKGFLGMFSK